MAPTQPPLLDVSGDLSSFVKRDDFADGPHRFRIASVTRETFEARQGRPSQTRIVLTFVDDRKFSLNKTNLKTLAKAWGKSADAWIGHTIEIFLNPDIEMGGEIVGGLRIRLVGQPTTSTTEGDDIAFAFGPNTNTGGAQ